MYNWNTLKRRENIRQKSVGKGCSIILLLEHGAQRCPDSSSAKSKHKTHLNVDEQTELQSLPTFLLMHKEEKTIKAALEDRCQKRELNSEELESVSSAFFCALSHMHLG